MPRLQRSDRYLTLPGAARLERQALCPRLSYAAPSALRMVEHPQSTPNLFRSHATTAWRMILPEGDFGIWSTQLRPLCKLNRKEFREPGR
jgi:hypothetical protein